MNRFFRFIKESDAVFITFWMLLMLASIFSGWMEFRESRKTQMELKIYSVQEPPAPTIK